MRKFITFGPALVVLLTALVTLFAAPAAVRFIGYANTDAAVQQARQTLTQETILKQMDRAVRAVADAVEPSVVHIAIEEGTGRGGRPQRIGQGSGWVYDLSGHIITNAHVVRGATRIVVQFQDGRTTVADVVGVDPTTDVAVIRVGAMEGLVPIQRATGLELHQGDRVYAFGSPFGFKFSMSEGIVSGLGRDPREVQGGSDAFGMYTNYIQTDAAVNPGNSGGPLANVEGKLVGMNVAIATARETSFNEGQNSGISFAIPLATIESVVDQLVKTGVVAKGYLGISHEITDEVNARRLDNLGFHGHGVVITGIPSDGPAAKAGILTDDVVTRINGITITGLTTLRSAIANDTPGDKVVVDVWRAGDAKSFPVTLGTLPPSLIEMREVARILESYGIAKLVDTDQGTGIAALLSPSRATTAGLRADMYITAVESTPIHSTIELLTALAEKGLHQGREVNITAEAARGRSVEVKISPRG